MAWTEQTLRVVVLWIALALTLLCIIAAVYCVVTVKGGPSGASLPEGGPVPPAVLPHQKEPLVLPEPDWPDEDEGSLPPGERLTMVDR